MKSMFISLDGIDGAGKSTQIELLKNWLIERGSEVICYRDPGATQLGESIREILLHREDIPLTMTAEMLLYMASRAQLVEEKIKPALASGKTVICDRFLLANVVYQGAAGGLDIDVLWSIGRIATGGFAPDATIVLDLDASVAFGRLGGSQDRLEKRGLSYFQAVRQGFLNEHAKAGGRSTVIDASQSIDHVQQRIRDFLDVFKVG
ncbi:MAG: dTMP kinase [Pirellulaceae bacterium]|nr:dTMP kinase [Pirellulaceae bacterium]